MLTRHHDPSHHQQDPALTRKSYLVDHAPADLVFHLTYKENLFDIRIARRYIEPDE